MARGGVLKLLLLLHTHTHPRMWFEIWLGRENLISRHFRINVIENASEAADFDV
jgi:hypothetical protein